MNKTETTAPSPTESGPPKSGPRVALFVTCLVDLMRPTVGFAALRLLERAGAQVVVPDRQTCCGQPAYNSGDRVDARAIAQNVIEAFAGYETVVAPSGSCTGMIRVHYPSLFEDDPDMRARAEDLAGRTMELTEYLERHLDLNVAQGELHATVTYHDSCAARRELGVVDAPRKLLATVDGLTLKELDDTESCCGFGGLFSVKYPEVSGAIVDKKAADVEGTGADLLVGPDLGCLMNVAGKLKRRGTALDQGGVRVFHIAEVLAGMTDAPGVGESEDESEGGGRAR